MTIDWYGIVNEYNDKYGTDYMSDADMLAGIYSSGKNIEEMTEMLGVSNTSITKKFRKYGIKMRQRGYVYSQNQLDFIKFIEDEDISQHTLRELSERFQLSWDFVRHRVRRSGQKCKKGPSKSRNIQYA